MYKAKAAPVPTKVMPSARHTRLGEVAPGTVVQMGHEPGWMVATTHPRRPDAHGTCAVLQLPAERGRKVGVTQGRKTPEFTLIAPESAVVAVEAALVIRVDMDQRTAVHEWLQHQAPGVMGLGDGGWHLAVRRHGNGGPRTDWYRCETGTWVMDWVPASDLYRVGRIEVEWTHTR